jgi:N4-gp56 family major capsid protein
MVDFYTTYAAMANDAPNVYISMKMIELLKKILVLEKAADQFSLENGFGKTLRVPRVARVSLPTAPLVEGVTPSTDTLVLETVNVTVEQWGLVVALTDVLELTVKHPMLSLAIERVALAMKETSEREDAEVLMAATNVTFAGTATTRATLVATDVFNTALAIAINAKLEMRGAHKYMDNGGYYMGFFQPPHKASILGSDATFQTASNFAKQERLMQGYVGEWMGIEWVMGNFLPVYVGVAAATTAAATATKAQYTVGTSGTLATANYQIKIVGREVTTDYERRLSVQTGNIAVTTPGSIAVLTPTSTNYVYDIYMTAAGGTIAYLVASRIAANTVFTITTAPATTEAVAPDSPALGINIYPGFVCGKGAYGTCMLNGMSLQTFTTPKGASDSDPIAQRRKVGAKYMRKTFILDNNYIERFETSSALAAAIPA